MEIKKDLFVLGLGFFNLFALIWLLYFILG